MKTLCRLTTITASSLTTCPVPLHALELPEGFVLGEGPAHALHTRGPGGKPRRRLAPAAFWPIAELRDGRGRAWIELAFLDTASQPGLHTVRFPAELQHAPRQLARLLGREGLVIDPGQSGRVTEYLGEMRAHNTLPCRQLTAQTGWTPDRSSFQYGPVALGGDSRLALSPGQPTTAESALFRTGSARGWTEAATAALEASPVLAVVLAASLASPMLRLFGWQTPSLGLEGPGASALLGMAASVFGSRALVARPGLPGRLTAPFHALGDLPHLLDATGMPALSKRRRGQLVEGLHPLHDGERVLATRTGTRLRISAGSALVALAPGMAELFPRSLERRYVPLRAPLTPAELALHEARLAQQQGHLGRALCEALTRLSVAERAQLSAEHGRCRVRLDPRPTYKEPLHSWSYAMATVLATVRVAARLVPTLCPDPARWEAQIEAAWREVLTARGLAPSSLRVLPGGGAPRGRPGGPRPALRPVR